MKNLIWKQWRESRFYFCVFSAWMILCALYAVGYELGHHYRAAIGSFSSSAMLYGILAAIILATRAAQGEQSDHTLAFTTSLPISIRRVASVRIVGAILTFAIPIAVGATIMAVSLATGLIDQATPRPIPSDYIQMPQRPLASTNEALEQLASVTGVAVMGGVELVIVLSLCGLFLRSQAQVACLGVLLALGFVVLAEPLWGQPARWPLGQLLYGIVLPQSLVVHWGYGDATGSYADHELAQYRWVSMGLALPLLAMIAWAYVQRYGKAASLYRPLKPSRFRFAVPSLLSKIAIPLPTRWIALIWLELRQSLPLAFYGLAIAVLVTIASQLSEAGHRHDLATSVRSGLPHSMFFVGMLWSIVVGSSLYSTDLDAKVGGFRRSRPIPHAMWFWNKFFVGLAAVLLVMDGTTILVSWNAPKDYPTSGMSYAYIACFPLLHALMYSLAVMGTCFFRRPLIGGVFAIVSYGIVTIAITTFPETMQLEPINVYNGLLITERAGAFDFMQHGYPIVYGFLLMMAGVFSAVSLRRARLEI